MPTLEIMTAEQGFNHSMNTYPSLYSAPTLEDAKLKYFDHIFNVLGNGYRDIEEFLDAHTIRADNKHLINSFPKKYIGDTPLFYAYTEVSERGGFKRGIDESLLPGLYTEEELKDLPQVVYEVQANGRLFFEDEYVFSPYPNFKKRYSMVWEDDIAVLDISWLLAAQDYYQKMQKFFNSENVHHYSSACPPEGQKLNQMIQDMDKAFTRYKTEGMSEEDYRAAVSKAYECEYTGDTKLFIQTRWSKELGRIHTFLDDTLKRLDTLIAPHEVRPKPKM